MSTKPAPTDLPIHTFATSSDLESFYSQSHSTLPGFYIKLAKKSSGIPTVTVAESVEVALCFGWIDGVGYTLDNTWWLKRYTPRRPKSIWSQKNVATVQRLLDEGRMRPAGLAAVEAAKADGRWERAYAGPATIEAPQDFLAVLGKEPKAVEFFDGLSKSRRYAVLWKVQTASVKGREKCIEKMVEMLTEGKVPGDKEEGAKGVKGKDEGVKKRSRLDAEEESSGGKRVVGKKVKKEAAKTEEIPTTQRRPGLRSRS